MSTLSIHQFDARLVTNALKKSNNGKSPKNRNTKYAYKW